MLLNQKLELISDILDIDVEELKPETEISSLEWDSIATLSFIAMMDEEFGKEVKGAQIRDFKTIQDALDLMEWWNIISQ